MVYTYEITAAEKSFLVETGERFLDIEYQILVKENPEDQNPQVLQTRKRAYQIETSAEEVKTYIQKELDAYVADIESAERHAVDEAQETKADETIKQLIGKENQDANAND
jgi:hypothetical protein